MLLLLANILTQDSEAAATRSRFILKTSVDLAKFAAFGALSAYALVMVCWNFGSVSFVLPTYPGPGLAANVGLLLDVPSQF